jgi:lipoprotein
MKKLLLFAVIAIVAFSLGIVGCSKDKEQDPIQWKFNVTAKTEKIETGLGTNDIVPLEFLVNKEYESGATITYSIISDKTNFNLTDREGNELAQNRKYELVGTSLKINYKGLEQGLHTIKVIFENDKKVSITKIITLNFVNYDFEYKITTAKKGEIYQAEEVLYNLEISNKNINAGDYEIKFTSYDDADPNLEKSVITFNSQKVEINKWYKISNLSNSEITIKSFYSGEKNLSYSIKNKNIVRNLILQQTVNKRGIVVTTSDVSKTNISKIGEQFKLKALLNKTPNKLSNKIYYKTWITISPEAPDEGITTTNNEYKEYSLTDEGYFEILLEAKKGGIYKYNIQFKDEWGNESLTTTKNITVDNKDFNIKVTQNYNTNEIYQGKELVNLIKIEQLQNVTNENYHIRFISFEDKDVSLSKSKIIFKHNDINPAEEELVMNEWKSLSEEDLLKGFFIKLKSFYTGIKKVKFEIKNSVSTKQYEFEINVKPIEYSIELERDKYEIGITEKTIFFILTFRSNVKTNNKIEYKITEEIFEHYRWVEKRVLVEWKQVNTDEKLQEKYNKELRIEYPQGQNYVVRKLKIQVRDEYGNSSEKIIEIKIKNDSQVEQALISKIVIDKSVFYNTKNQPEYQAKVRFIDVRVKAKAMNKVSFIIGEGEPIAYIDVTNNNSNMTSVIGEIQAPTAPFIHIEKINKYNSKIPYIIKVLNSDGDQVSYRGEAISVFSN